VLVDGRCDGCGLCVSVCPRHAISMIAEESGQEETAGNGE
jgi:Pyruvate/2-oxoacid:ferredoxin oxidoreductase delta subunit